MREHYYNISFMDEGGRCRSAIITSPYQRVTARDIAGVYMELDLSDNTIVMAVSYMGYMSAEEYANGAPPRQLRFSWIGPACCLIPFLVLGLVVWLTR
ncbi:hypothetical protein FR773_26070 (plasmid) [Leclercia adecarboxylata]|uniref:hypothetical protein n=1 Tax=Leclercia adecarboxylata TaxID=83655 RepID=UPI0012A9DFEE|nr:hypothetical protein [Leclercia adecarboxylata]QFH68101.1 hypothetical protein FR773_26070 [Leclercia adecarboxylata]